MKRTAPNLPINVGTKTDLWNKVMKEFQKRRYAGPFKDIPFEHFIQSPIGLVLKDNGRDTRLIFHLSYSKGGMPVNSETPDSICAVVYPDFNDAVRLCMRTVSINIKLNGKSIAYSGKSDMQSAFRNLPFIQTGLYAYHNEG